MKKIQIALFGLIPLFMIVSTVGAIAQNDMNTKAPQPRPEKKGPQKNFSKDDLKSMKIAFFTDQLNLTPEEAEKFWPVYRECEKKIFEARRATQKIQKELNEAIAYPKKSDSEIKQLSDSYYLALDNENAVSKENLSSYQKVLPLRKAVKVRLTDEKFYRHLVGKLKLTPAPPHNKNNKTTTK